MDTEEIQPSLRSIRSVGELLAELKQQREGEQWFRGHRDASWLLLPSAFRDPDVKKKEAELIARFRQQAAIEGVRYGLDSWGWLTFAQHHGVPTRLLDWSENPLVGMFFAIEESHDGRTEDGMFITLNPYRLNEEAGDSGNTIRLLLDTDDDINSYYPGRTGLGSPPRAVLAPMSFDRIRYQTGMFTVSTPNNGKDLAASGAITQYIIPYSAKAELRHELSCLGVNEATIYRDLDRVARRIKELA